MNRFARLTYDLAVKYGLARYRRPWVVSASHWDDRYAAGALTYYAGLREQGRLQLVIGLIGSFVRPPRVLDIGCGDGTLRGRIQDSALTSYLGLDIAETAIAQATARAFPKSHFRVGELPRADEGPFDIIALTDMIYYVEDIPALLRELKPHLAPDGWLVVLYYRHPGDVALDRMIRAQYAQVDTNELISHGEPRFAWIVSAYRHPGPLSAPAAEDVTAEDVAAAE